jgi:hypothetical protein
MNVTPARNLLLGVVLVSTLTSIAEAVSEIQYRAPGVSSNQAPGLPAGVNFSGFSNPRINDSGEVVFRSSLTGPGVSAANDRTLWSEGGGGLHLIAREGTAAPGAGVGSTMVSSSVRISAMPA